MLPLRDKQLFRLVAAAVVRFYPQARTTVVILQIIYDLAVALKADVKDPKQAAEWLDQTDFWNASTESKFIPLFNFIYRAQNAINRLSVTQRGDRLYWNKMLAAGIITNLQIYLLSGKQPEHALTRIEQQKIIDYMASLMEYVGELRFHDYHVKILQELAEIDALMDVRDNAVLRVAAMALDRLMRGEDGELIISSTARLQPADLRQLYLSVESVKTMLLAAPFDNKNQLIGTSTRNMEQAYLSYMQSAFPHTWSLTTTKFQGDTGGRKEDT